MGISFWLYAAGGRARRDAYRWLAEHVDAIRSKGLFVEAERLKYYYILLCWLMNPGGV